jgi:mismatch-specific thymine-DNA glycosylase
MIHYQASSGLKIIFIGINPHPGSAARGIPFSNNKMFWYLLSDAGLIEEPREWLKNDKNLKKLFLHMFMKKYKFGILNVVDRPTRSTVELKRAEALPGRKKLNTAFKKYQPNVICFVGKITYSMFREYRAIKNICDACTASWSCKCTH